VLATGFEPAVAQPVSSSRAAVRRRCSPTVARQRGLLGEFEKRSATDTDAPPGLHPNELRWTLVADCTLTAAFGCLVALGRVRRRPLPTIAPAGTRNARETTPSEGGPQNNHEALDRRWRVPTAVRNDEKGKNQERSVR